MRYPIERLDKDYMISLFFRLNKGSIPLSDINYYRDKDVVKVGKIEDEYDLLVIWDDGSHTIYGCPELDENQAMFEVSCVLRNCENCKHYDSKTFSCLKTGKTCLSSEKKYCEKDRVSLFIDDHDIDVDYTISEDEYLTADGYFPAEAIEESVAISFGKYFCCKFHEFKEEK